MSSALTTPNTPSITTTTITTTTTTTVFSSPSSTSFTSDESTSNSPTTTSAPTSGETTGTSSTDTRSSTGTDSVMPTTSNTSSTPTSTRNTTGASTTPTTTTGGTGTSRGANTQTTPTTSNGPTDTASFDTTSTTEPTQGPATTPTSTFTTQQNDAQTTPLPSATPGTTHVSTASTPISLTTTNSLGQTVTTTPASFTTVLVSTESNGQETTLTQVVANPTGFLSPDPGGNVDVAFFNNKPAVAGVFVIVGLAGTSILLFILFAWRRRQRKRQQAREENIARGMAAAASGMRSPFADSDDGMDQDPEMRQHHYDINGQEVRSTSHLISAHSSVYGRQSNDRPVSMTSAQSLYANAGRQYYGITSQVRPGSTSPTPYPSTHHPNGSVVQFPSMPNGNGGAHPPSSFPAGFNPPSSPPAAYIPPGSSGARYVTSRSSQSSHINSPPISYDSHQPRSIQPYPYAYPDSRYPDESGGEDVRSNPYSHPDDYDEYDDDASDWENSVDDHVPGATRVDQRLDPNTLLAGLAAPQNGSSRAGDGFRQIGSQESIGLRDDEDYTRKVLAVRNLSQSQARTSTGS